MDIMKIIDSERFIFFLRWLVEERNWEASEIIGVVERPNGYQKYYDQYLEEQNEVV
jgi:hypothetical protein|tara:strand:+ start:392 stop:559 length:168 start_codon:yes stop_codon:yes gene_type:complete